MLYCDWCRLSIETADFATLEVGGTYSDGKRIRARARTYHTSHEYSDGPSGASCLGKMLRLLNDDREFKQPDAGMAWQLVPCSEGHHYVHSYNEPRVGTTPLEELSLTDATYKTLTRRGVFTVEQLVDARTRGEDVLLKAPQLARVDAVLLERGLLPGQAAEREGA